jgi:hypothetical protein
MLQAVAPFALGLLLGGMGLFSFLVAPTAFAALKAEDAGRFVRALFPRYHLFVAGTAALAAVGLIGANPELALLMFAAAGLAVLARQVLTPRINALRDRHLAGDAAAGRWFDRMHMASVALNVVTMAAAAAAFALHA